MNHTANGSWNQIIDRKNSHSIKWDAMENFVGKGDLMPYWVADMDFYSPEAVIRSLVSRAEHGVFGYTYEDGEALDAFVNWVAKRHQLKVEKEWIVRTPGVVTAIGIAIQSYTEPGDGILIQPPVYAPFSEMTEINGRKVVNNPLTFDGEKYQMDFEHLKQVMQTEKPKMMILCNPHNPVGRVWSKEEVAQVVSLCAQNEVLLFSDEIHSDLVFKGSRFQSALGIEEADLKWMLSAMAPSKTFNIAGLFYSMILIPDEERRKAFKQTMDKLHLMPVNCFNETAAKAAYQEGEDWLESLMAYLEENYRQLETFVHEKMPEVVLTKMEGTYLAWLDFRKWNDNGYLLKRFMIDEAGVAVNDGRAFGKEGEGFIRFNFGCPRKVMLEGLEAICEARARTLESVSE